MRSNNQPVMDHRRLRLIELMATLNVPRVWFAAAMQRSETYFARLVLPPTNRHRKNMGDALAAEIVQRLHLTPGWFDLPLGTNLPNGLRIVNREGRIVFPAVQENLYKAAGLTLGEKLPPLVVGGDRFLALSDEDQEHVLALVDAIIKSFEDRSKRKSPT